jgi:AcrR family transcriptional regulator
MAATALTARPVDLDVALEDRIIDAALGCVAQWGVAKTTGDDVARAAGVSRATLYRVFPGGRDVLLDAVVGRELGRFFHAVTDRLGAATSLEDLVVDGIVQAAAFLRGHDALRYVLTHEPHLVLPAFAFHRLEPALAVATAFTAPHLRRFAPSDEVATAHAEWLVRVVLSYVINPTDQLDLTDPVGVRRFAHTYLLPALAAPQPTS